MTREWIAASAALLGLCLLAPPAAQATEATAEAVTSMPAPASPANPADAALRRVLSTGCLEGLDAVYPLAGDPTAPWAETVLRLCGEVLRDKPPARRPGTGAQTDTDGLAVETVARRHEAAAQEGRGRLVLWSSLYGIWLGIAADVLLDVNGSRAVILPPMIGMAVGLGLSIELSRDAPITIGQAWTIITGMDYGSANGALWAAAFDGGSKAVVGTALATGFAATAAGLAVADAATPSAGDIELVRSGLLWGGTAGFLAMAALSPDGSFDGNRAALGTAAAMDAGFLGALGLARRFDLTRNRVLLIDTGALGGALAGLGIAWLATGDAGEHRRALTGATLGGLVGGIALAAYATRDLDERGRDLAESSRPAFWSRRASGDWGPGSPAPTPVLDGPGRRVVGATVNALGGVF